MHVTLTVFLVAATVVSIGSLVQGSVGFGLNLLSAPFIAIVVPAALPATLVLVAFPLAVSTLVREHHAVERRPLRWMLLGAVPGTLVGLAIIGQVDSNELAIVVGGITLTGVALSVVSPPVPINRLTAVVAGLASNLFGTASSVGGPPVALLFQHRHGPATRSTLGGFFSASALLSIIGYIAIGKITADQAWFALSLAPFMIVGLWTSRHLHGHVDSGWLRPALLTLSAAAGAVAILHTVA